MRYLSLFSGIEAASVAWEPLGWTPVAFAEIEPFPCALLAHRFPAVPNLGDVTRITDEQIAALGPIDVVIGEDRQPHMDHFVEGVWRSFQLTAEEDVAVRNATTLHAVLVDPVAAEVHRLGDTGLLDNVRVSGDFLDLRHYSLDRFAATMQHLALGFVGWPGDPDDPVVHGPRSIAEELGRTLVITLGSRGVLLVVGATTRFVPVSAVQVTGTTVGCGDSFIAAFLAELHLGGTIDEALDAGRAAGAAATTWLRPLPDEAYAPTTR